MSSGCCSSRMIFVDPEDEVPLAEYLRVFERSDRAGGRRGTVSSRGIRMRVRFCGSPRYGDELRRWRMPGAPCPPARHCTARETFRRRRRAARGHHRDDVLRIFNDAAPARSRPPRTCAGPRHRSRRQLDGGSDYHSFAPGTLSPTSRHCGLCHAGGHYRGDRTGDEIIDETDVYVDVDNHVKVDGRSKFDFTGARSFAKARLGSRRCARSRKPKSRPSPSTSVASSNNPPMR